MTLNREKKPTNVDNCNFTIIQFDMGASYKEQAVKCIEEAAEVLGATQTWEYAKDNMDVEAELKARLRVLDEIADTIQAAINMAHILGFDVKDVAKAMDDCIMKNKKRGRF